jgi:hypothetical protein
MKSIVSEVILHPKEDKKTDGHSDGKAYDVDTRMERVFADISQGYREIIFKHRHPPVKRSIQKSRKRFYDLTPYPDSCLESAFCANPMGIHIFKIPIKVDIILAWENPPQQP